jgi:hypothetical protein
VEYRWDADTDILTARLAAHVRPAGQAGSVELEGTDGSWLILDLAGDRIAGVEVAVWPDVHQRPALAAPSVVEDAHVAVPPSATQPSVHAIEVETPLRAEADDAERVIYFRVGDEREARTIRLGQDLLLDVDPASKIAGLWLLNVPPFPER